MDKIFISKEEASNKFWGYTCNDVAKTVTAHWGRLGLAGQSKVHSFNSGYEMDDFVSSKTREKLRGGYGEVTLEQYEVEAAIAKTIGVDQKVDQLLFVEEKGDTLTSLDATKLHNPDIKPFVYARLIGKKKDGVNPVTEFIFTPNESFLIETISRGAMKVSKKMKLSESDVKMAAAVEEVIGRMLF